MARRVSSLSPASHAPACASPGAAGPCADLSRSAFFLPCTCKRWAVPVPGRTWPALAADYNPVALTLLGIDRLRLAPAIGGPARSASCTLHESSRYRPACVRFVDPVESGCQRQIVGHGRGAGADGVLVSLCGACGADGGLCAAPAWAQPVQNAFLAAPDATRRADDCHDLALF